MRRFRKQNNSNFPPNMGSLRSAIAEKWDKMYEEFILEACQIVMKVCCNNNWKKWWPYWVNSLFFCLSSYFNVYFLWQKSILFYDRVVNYFPWISLILILHPVEECMNSNIQVKSWFETIQDGLNRVLLYHSQIWICVKRTLNVRNIYT